MGVEPGVLKGRVVGTDGKPVQGAQIVADNQLLYRTVGQCSGVHAGGEGPRGSARQGASVL
ncbi:hypothetical protein [Nonomuraea sp. NPDC048826]|uniref:hypothetical protein n=1 Tax=Nonomuraea sp. NPDC048826 TaxID=3364347 RepID=UPI003721C579